MIFGHNSNVIVGGVKYHVQTEDAGVATAVIDTMVYCGGRVLHRRTSNYSDLIASEGDREAAIKHRLDEQHRQVMDEIRGGALSLPVLAAPEAIEKPKPPVTQASQSLSLELLNPKSWLAGKQGTLHIQVKDAAGSAVEAAKVTAHVLGAADSPQFTAETDSRGEAQLVFDMPRITEANGALIVQAALGMATGQLRFQLRAK